MKNFTGREIPQDLDTNEEKNEKRSRGGSKNQWLDVVEKCWQQVPSRRPEGLGWKREQ